VDRCAPAARSAIGVTIGTAGGSGGEIKKNAPAGGIAEAFNPSTDKH